MEVYICVFIVKKRLKSIAKEVCLFSALVWLDSKKVFGQSLSPTHEGR